MDQALQVEISLGDETGIVPSGVFGKSGLPDPPRLGPVKLIKPSQSAKPQVIPATEIFY